MPCFVKNLLPPTLTMFAAVFLIVGCSGQPVQPTVEPPTASEPVAESKQSNPVPASGGDESDLLYNVILGEIAGQRGQFTVAADHYIAAARQSGDARLVKRATQISLYSGDLDLAIASAEAWRDLEPESQDVLQVLAAFQLQKGDREGARKNLVQLLSMGEYKTSTDYLKLARFFIRSDDQKPMLDVLEEIAAEKPNDPEVLRAYLLLAIQLEQPERALEKSARLVELEAEPLANALLHVEVLKQNAKEEEAIIFLQGYLQRNPKESKARLQLARLYIDLKQYQSAREEFLPLYQEDPQDQGVLLALSLVSLQLDNLDEARKYLSSLTKIDAQKDRAFYYLGQVADRQGKSAEALDWYAKVLDEDFRLDAVIQSAGILNKQDRLDDALKLLRNQSLSGRQNQLRLYLGEVQLLLEAEQFQQALQAADRGISLYADSVELLLARSTAREKLNQLEGMEDDLRKVLELDEENAHALNALGYVFADRGIRLQEARELIAKALALAPDNPFITDSMGWIEYRLGNFSAAVQHLQRALEILPDPEVYSHLAEVLWAMGKKEEAHQTIQKGLKDTPEDKRLLGVLKKFSE